MPELSNDSHRFCIAPMLDWTDRHARFFLRLFSKHIRLYTEMVTANAINFGDSERFLHFNKEEHPVALQLGGSDPEALITACTTAQPYHYDEINLNVGCPSDRVQSGRFGACLMLDPKRVAECYQAMVSASNVPISIKCRIGVDEQDSEAFLHTFIDTLYQAGCRIFIIHARKAWLNGLSPKQNREIPPLHYDRVYRIKAQFPDAKIVINGGVTTMDATRAHLTQCDGVMMGREAYHNPYILSNIDQTLFNETSPALTREEILKKMVIYIEQECQKGVKLNHITRHMLGLYHGLPGARQFRRQLSGSNIQAGLDEIRKAL
ncbi:MAG: tRNA dihydrouridine(20/20a) synthase DusA [Cellvibrionales bacterium]|nr:tRNA dihydrouridine(20/20a) synthase DusA [Cellvibrionales bacterium]